MVPRNTYNTLLVLGVILDAGSVYGMELIQTTGIKSGSLYQLLARLEKAGWLTGQTEEVDPHLVGRPRRRYYKLTDLGQQEARRVTSILTPLERCCIQAGRPHPRGGSDSGE